MHEFSHKCFWHPLSKLVDKYLNCLKLPLKEEQKLFQLVLDVLEADLFTQSPTALKILRGLLALEYEACKNKVLNLSQANPCF